MINFIKKGKTEHCNKQRHKQYQSQAFKDTAEGWVKLCTNPSK